MKAAGKTQIGIVEDNNLIREGIQFILKDESWIIIHPVLRDGNEFIQLKEDEYPDILIVDLNMPGMNGYQLIKKIREKNGDVKILVLTIMYDYSVLKDLLLYNINGYILKEASQSELIEAIKCISKGGSYFGKGMKNLHDTVSLKSGSKENIAQIQLSDNEEKLLKMLSEGKSKKEIRSSLLIPQKRLVIRQKALMEKINADSLSDLIKYALFHKYIE